jgi:hypothetical protein
VARGRYNRARGCGSASDVQGDRVVRAVFGNARAHVRSHRRERRNVERVSHGSGYVVGICRGNHEGDVPGHGRRAEYRPLDDEIVSPVGSSVTD